MTDRRRKPEMYEGWQDFRRSLWVYIAAILLFGCILLGVDAFFDPEVEEPYEITSP